MNEFNDINDLLNQVLADEEPETEVKDKAPAEPEQEVLDTSIDDAVITADDLVTDPVLDIENIIAEASGELTEDELEEADSAPEGYTGVTPVPQSSKVFSKGAGDEAIPMPEFTTDELLDEIDIRNFGTLVTLRTARWHAKVTDKRAAKKQAADDSAIDGTYETKKKLLAGADEKLKCVHAAIDSARTAHYSMTLPWSVVAVNETGKRSGARLLPNTLFMEYTTAVANAKAEMDGALSEFVTAYPDLIDSAKQKMGGAFNQLEYPAPESIEQHFDLQFDFAPIPKGSDFDALQNQMSGKLADTLNRRTRMMLENAMQDAWLKLYKTVKHAYDTLANPDKMFHYTLVDKLRDQASSLKYLNVTGDDRIEEIRELVEDKLTKHDAKDIRKDDALRKLLAEHASDIHERMREIADET